MAIKKESENDITQRESVYSNNPELAQIDRELEELLKVLASLEPRPGRRYTGEMARYITPDVFVTKIGDDYVVMLNDEQIPHLRISNSYRELMAQDKLRELAVVLTETIRQNASIDWTIKESVKAKLKVAVKRILRKFGYPPDMQLLATETVLKQAELIANELTNF